MPKIEEFQDIMPPVAIDMDYTQIIYLLIALFFGVAALFLAAHFIKKIISKPKLYTKEEIALKKLKALDFENPTKQLLYDFTLLSKECIGEKQGLDNILRLLEPYKYTKDDKPIEKSVIKKLKEYADAATL